MGFQVFVHVAPTLTVLLMFGRADMEVQSLKAQTDPSKDAGIRRLWTMALRFLSLTTRIHHKARLLVSRNPSGLREANIRAKNMTAPVVSKLTERAAMGCRAVEVLTGYQDMMPSTTSFTAP